MDRAAGQLDGGAVPPGAARRQPALHEVSLITAEESGVFLRVRHLHAALDVPEKQADVKMYKL